MRGFLDQPFYPQPSIKVESGIGSYKSCPSPNNLAETVTPLRERRQRWAKARLASTSSALQKKRNPNNVKPSNNAESTMDHYLAHMASKGHHLKRSPP